MGFLALILPPPNESRIQLLKHHNFSNFITYTVDIVQNNNLTRRLDIPVYFLLLMNA
jgi:hypothetical protein